jgi:uncharacterized protein (DUF1501 family)
VIARRTFLGGCGALAGAGGLGSLPASGQSTSDYKALVVINLFGGCDGHHMLVPTDGAYGDYQASRANLALSRASLVALPGVSAGHSFGLHPGLASLAPLYAQQRLGFIANVGPLVVPSTARQVLDNAVPVPPFLLAHPEQVAVQQGWLVTADNDTSGWAGRALELLPSQLRHARAGLTTGAERTLVLGRRTPTSLLTEGTSYWGNGSLLDPSGPHVQSLMRMAASQSTNAYQADYANQMKQALDDSTAIARAFEVARAPTGDFGSDGLSGHLRTVAKALPAMRSLGARRQAVLVSWGTFDTHVEQRGAGPTTQDTQLPPLARALSAFDTAMHAAGMGQDVITLVMTDFGRTLRPSSGGGSEHAWGNHWLLMGGPVAGGAVHGIFPTLTLGGPDDGDPDRGGRLVPTTATDQVAATLTRWLGLPASALFDVFPKLPSFAQATLPSLLRA